MRDPNDLKHRELVELVRQLQRYAFEDIDDGNPQQPFLNRHALWANDMAKEAAHFLCDTLEEYGLAP